VETNREMFKDCPLLVFLFFLKLKSSSTFKPSFHKEAHPSFGFIYNFYGFSMIVKKNLMHILYIERTIVMCKVKPKAMGIIGRRACRS
jgi:hypothetical protein